MGKQQVQGRANRECAAELMNCSLADGAQCRVSVGCGRIHSLESDEVRGGGHEGFFSMVTATASVAVQVGVATAPVAALSLRPVASLTLISAAR